MTAITLRERSAENERVQPRLSQGQLRSHDVRHVIPTSSDDYGFTKLVIAILSFVGFLISVALSLWIIGHVAQTPAIELAGQITTGVIGGLVVLALGCGLLTASCASMCRINRILRF